MELMKSHWVADENRIHLTVPFAKIDKENRRVTGFATLDNIDEEGDQVSAAASKSAFSAFRGNIREMHQPIAAGRLVDFKEDSFYDKKTNKFYRGIFVTAYISKGAQDTWEKVLDGTLTGFSIGGNITDSETVWNKDIGKSIRIVKSYFLGELSLVDNPCNQLANFFAITKNTEGAFMKGMMADTQITNVFWCDKDEIAKASPEENSSCPSCGSMMKNIDWFEMGDEESKVGESVTKYLRQEEEGISKNGYGGVKMSDELNKSAEEGDDKKVDDATPPAVDAGDVTDGTGAESDDDKKAEEAKVEEAPTEPNFEKMFKELSDSVTKSVEGSKAKVDEALESVEKRIAEVSSDFDEKFEKALKDIDERLAGVKTAREGVEKRLDVLESATAIKKSGEVETKPEEELKKGLWSGTIFADVS